MNPKEIEELLQREPFLPFRIFVTNGDKVDITRALSVAVGRNGLFIVLPDDRWKWIPLRHVSSVETLQAA
ncbi:MAG TPA: hypothetical protein VHD56_05465 [Tepidisphaeraceae bacterium]|nr:hypothetical protein [Tepidisphaeraceae bacterium]